MPKEKAESSGNTAAHHELDPKTAGLQEDRHEAEGKPGDEDKSAEAVEKGMIKGTPARPHRGRPGKRGKEPNYSEQLDLEANPQQRDMSPAWQRFYAAVRKAARDE